MLYKMSRNSKLKTMRYGDKKIYILIEVLFWVLPLSVTLYCSMLYAQKIVMCYSPGLKETSRCATPRI